MPTVTATDFRDRTIELTEQAMRVPADPIIIQRRGKAAVVLLDAKYYEGLLETLEILSDPKAMDLIRRSIAEAESGQVTPHSTVMKELGINGKHRHRDRVDKHSTGKPKVHRQPRHAEKNRVQDR